MFTLIFHPVADADLSDNYWWYVDKEVGLGERFEAAVLGSLKKTMRPSPALHLFVERLQENFGTRVPLCSYV